MNDIVVSKGQLPVTDASNFNINEKSASKAEEEMAPILTADIDQVVETISYNMAQVKEDLEQMAKVSESVLGHKVEFNINQELNQIVVSIVDPKTNKVIKQIPSSDVQKIKANIRKTMGLLFDELV